MWSRNEQALLARPAPDATLAARFARIEPRPWISWRCAATVPRQRACSAARDTAVGRTLLSADDLAILPAADERLLAAVFEDVRSPRPCMGDGSGCSSFKTRFARCSE